MKTRLLSLFVALFATTALWAYDFKSGAFYYNITSSTEPLTAEVTYQENYSSDNYAGLTSAIIPATVNYYGYTFSVTSIGSSAFYGCTGLTSITIPNSVTSIGSSAFYGCTGLTSVSIGNSVTSIGDYAFKGCTGLTSITIPNSVTSIGERAFKGCTGLTSITIPNSVTNIGNGAFYGCTGLTSITIPNSVTSIGRAAFSDCTGLTSVTIGNSVTSIGSSAFYGCTGLTSVSIGNSVTSIGDYAFMGCTGLTSITIPNSVTSIGECAFCVCTGLTSIVIESGNTIYDSREDCNAIIETSTNTLLCGCQNTIIPNSVTGIGDCACFGCTGLTSITIPNSVTSIGSSAFYGCTGLTSITIPNGVTSIGGSAFSGCTGLTSITIPNSVTSIGDDAFRGCTGLDSIVWNAVKCSGWRNYYASPFYSIKDSITTFTFGDSVESIPDYLCYGMSKVSSITIPKSITSIGNRTFDGCIGLDSIVWNAVKCSGWSNYNASPFYSMKDSITSFTFGDSVESIPNYLCYGMSKLTSMTIPESITSIGSSAFGGCTGLTSITIPHMVTSIGSSAFSGCEYLEEVSIGAGIKEIGENAFANDRRIYSVTCYASVTPTIYSTTFSGVSSNTELYVLANLVKKYKVDEYWGKFTIRSIGVETTQQGKLSVVPSETEAVFTWPADDNAETYTIVIKKDDVVFCTLCFNGDGQLTNIAFAPSRDGAKRQSAAESTTGGYRFTVTGLSAASHYVYQIAVKDIAENVLNTYEGEFNTTGYVNTDVDEVVGNTENMQVSKKIYRDGQVYILRNGKTYTLSGNEVK